MNPNRRILNSLTRRPAAARSNGRAVRALQPMWLKSPPPRLTTLECRVRRSRKGDAVTPADPDVAQRECLAQFVHDQIGGIVVQLRLAYGAWRHESLAAAAEAHPQAAPQVEAPPAAAVMDGLLGELSGIVRRVAFSLAPPNWHDDLATALESVAAELRLRGSLVVCLDTTALQAGDVPPLGAPARNVLCRVVRELGLNVRKHAAARSVQIHARSVSGRLQVCVEDDGRGLPGDAVGRMDGLGLRSARAQLMTLGGDLALRSLPGGGTRATLWLPIRHPPRHQTRRAWRARAPHLPRETP